MANLNQVILVGNFVRDVEVQHTQSGLAYTRYTVAIDRPMNRDGKRGVDFSSCVAFGKMAENLGKLGRKGRLVYVDGHVRSSSFTDKNGNHRSSMNIATNNFEILTPRDSNNDSNQNYSSSYNQNTDRGQSTNQSYNQGTNYQSANNQGQARQDPREPNQDINGAQVKNQMNKDSIQISDDSLPF